MKYIYKHYEINITIKYEKKIMPKTQFIILIILFSYF